MAQLQQKLADLGYYPGPVDGRFGLLTEEALFQLQMDFRLRPDGVAGRQVAQLLEAGLSAGLRLVHTAAPGEDLYGLAERFGVSPTLLQTSAGRRVPAGGRRWGRPLESGTRLVIPIRPVFAVVGEVEEADRLRRALIRQRRQITALVAPVLKLKGEGLSGGKPDTVWWELAKELSLPLLARVEVETPDGLAPTGRRRRQGVAELAQAVARYRWPAVQLSFAELAPGERYAAAGFATALRRILPASTQVWLEVPAPSAGTAAGGATEERLAAADLAAVDRLVLRLPPEPPEGGDRPLVRRLLLRHPCYRLLLGLPATGFRAALASRLSLVTRLALSGVVLWEAAAAEGAVFRAMADLFSVQTSQAWAAGRRNIRRARA